MNKIISSFAFCLSITACTTADSPDESQTGETAAPTWEQFQANPPVTWLTFRASAKSVPESPSTFIVDGDIAVRGEAQLRELYDRWLKQEYAARLGSDSALTVYNVLGADVLWSSSQKTQLSYCVSDTFGSRKAELVEALDRATKSWSHRVDVQFNYVPTQDANCGATNTNVVFDVIPSSSPDFYASSFFPNEARGDRELFVTDAAFTTTQGGRDLEGIMRHELGHSLGFRHEHIHITCTGETTSDSRQVTTYDVNSVMHYPQCRPSNTGGYRQTELDYQGAISLYGAAAYIAFQASDGYLWTAGGLGTGSLSLGMYPASSPSLVKLASGGYQIAFAAADGKLWTTGSLGSGDLGFTIRPGTSPSITEVTGGYQIAFQAPDTKLWTTGALGSGDLGFTMAALSSPSITTVTGGYQIAFQASNAKLWTTGALGSGDLGYAMKPETSPSLIAVTGGYEIAFQNNNGYLSTTGALGSGIITLSMAAGTSPSIAARSAGGYDILVRSSTGYLWRAGTVTTENLGLGMAAFSSPSAK